MRSFVHAGLLLICRRVCQLRITAAFPAGGVSRSFSLTGSGVFLLARSSTQLGAPGHRSPSHGPDHRSARLPAVVHGGRSRLAELTHRAVHSAVEAVTAPVCSLPLCARSTPAPSHDRQLKSITRSCSGRPMRSDSSNNRINQIIQDACLSYSVSAPEAACEHLAKSFGIG